MRSTKQKQLEEKTVEALKLRDTVLKLQRERDTALRDLEDARTTTREANETIAKLTTYHEGYRDAVKDIVTIKTRNPNTMWPSILSVKKPGF